MNCNEIKPYLDTYWQLDEEDPLRIEIEAHIFECEHCMCKLGYDTESISFSDFSYDQAILDTTAMNKNVMDRIYAEQAWYMPIASKSYQFSKTFRRNIAIIIACCLAMFSVALFLFVFDYREETNTTTAHVSGVVDIAKATNDSFATSAIYKGQIPVASISDPIILQVVPTFPQYYVALSLLGIIMTILVMNWFSRTKS